MTTLNYLFIVLIFIAILISINAGFYLVTSYRTRLAIWGGFILFSQALELVFYLFQWVNPPPSVSLFFYLIQALSYTLFCIFWVIFLMAFTGNWHWIKRRYLALLIAIPSIYLLLMAAYGIQNPVTNPQQGMMVGSLMLSPLTGGLPGILFIGFGYGVDLFSIIVMLQFYLRSNSLIRKLVLPLLAGPFLLGLVSALELTGANPIQPVSIHQLGFASISLLALWAVVDLRFRNMLSTARETVVDQMQDGVLVLDQQDRIVDINAAAQRIIGLNSRKAVKQNLDQIWPEGAALIASQPDVDLSVGETTILVNGLESTFDINISHLSDAYREPIGRVIVMRNITGRERMEKALSERARELQRTNSFMAALAEVTVNLQTTADPSQINTILGTELRKLSLFCFIAQIDPATDELFISDLSALPEVIKRIEKILRANVIGFRLDKKLFSPLYKILESNEISFKKYRQEDLSFGQGKIPAIIMEQVIRLAGLETEMAALVIPLVTGNRTLGVIGVWGGDFRETDIPPFRIFASQVAQVMERAILYKKEIQRSSELTRSNGLIIALSKVASVLQTTSNSELVLDTLGNEMSKAGLNCAVVSFDEAYETAIVKYLSFDPKIISMIEGMTGVQMKDYAIPKRYWPGVKILTEQYPIWYPKASEILPRMFPTVPGGLEKKVFPLVGFNKEYQLCFLPLRIGDQLIGAMPIWGANLKPEDSLILSVFGAQVAGIIRNVRNYENEVQRKDELSRANRTIIALSNVAARLDTTSDLSQVFNTLGDELRKVGLNCMVGTLDDAKQMMKIEYLSIPPEIIKWAEKLGAYLPKEITIPRRLWPTDKAITERAPYWDPDPIESTNKMFPYIPKQVFQKTYEMAGIGQDTPLCYLPMTNDEEVIGILAVWGPDLRQEDVPGLSVFANQLATAVKNTRLYNVAQKEIIDRTQAEIQIQAALNEKEVLLKEIHHRVKNNLQVISSLLNLQAAQISDNNSVNVLRESQNRVRSMALIHEMLYQSNDLARVDFGRYLQNLVNSLAQTYSVKTEKLTIKTHSDKVLLDIDTAIPCGLIVNELVSNSIKYAFPGEYTGTIEVSCSQAQDGKCTLVVRDDGVGLPVGFDVTRSQSLGLKLVNSLLKQIEGNWVIENNHGTLFEIVFMG